MLTLSGGFWAKKGLGAGGVEGVLNNSQAFGLPSFS